MQPGDEGQRLGESSLTSEGICSTESKTLPASRPLAHTDSPRLVPSTKTKIVL